MFSLPLVPDVSKRHFIAYVDSYRHTESVPRKQTPSRVPRTQVTPPARSCTPYLILSLDNETQLTLVRQYGQTVAPSLQLGEVRSSWSLEITQHEFMQSIRGHLPVHFHTRCSVDSLESSRIQFCSVPKDCVKTRIFTDPSFLLSFEKPPGSLYPKGEMQTGTPCPCCRSTPMCSLALHMSMNKCSVDGRRTHQSTPF